MANYKVSVGMFGGGTLRPTGWYDVRAYGAVGDGVTDDSSAFNSAVQAAISAGGGTVVVPRGTYVVETEVLVDDTFSETSGVFISGDGINATNIVAGADNINIIHWSGNYGGIDGVGLDGNGYTGVSGLRLTPVDESQTSTLVHQDYNQFRNMRIEDCSEGIVLQCGPYVGSSVSGCYFNTFSSIYIQRCTRGIYFKDGPNALSSGSNRNQFFGCRIGLSMNTGIQIDCGGTNSFFGCSIEEVSAGTSPNATPTGIKILATAPVGTRGNGNNMFYGLMIEACTRDLDCEATTSEFYGHSIAGSKINVSGNSTVPNVFLSAQSGTVPVGYKKQQYNNAMNDELGNGAPEIFVKGGAVPSGDAFYAPVGSVVLHTSGVPYVKYSTGTTDWRALKSDVVAAATADDTTPSVGGGTRFLALPANTGATAITQLDDASAYQQVTLICTSGTNPATIADSGNFNLSSAWAPGSGDTLTVLTTNGTDWYETARSNN